MTQLIIDKGRERGDGVVVPEDAVGAFLDVNLAFAAGHAGLLGAD
jgi:hypothetical protein